MSLLAALSSSLAPAVQPTFGFVFDPETKTWKMDGHLVIKNEAEQLNIDDKRSWDFTVRSVVSHEPKLRLREWLHDLKLDVHPKGEEIFELVDHALRIQRQDLIDSIFQVYESRK